MLLWICKGDSRTAYANAISISTAFKSLLRWPWPVMTCFGYTSANESHKSLNFCCRVLPANGKGKKLCCPRAPGRHLSARSGASNRVHHHVPNLAAALGTFWKSFRAKWTSRSSPKCRWAHTCEERLQLTYPGNFNEYIFFPRIGNGKSEFVV